ncbi:sosondowah ankyrin repeat domain family member B [Phyllostomus discolor]|uniref:Sosondowah ankyrin repeat domain family member B n=1 Tax=Phyllostomus discolor TaxID=89673 RepID=A0A834BQC0_9CHIR|nr:sosondowah ankyrin repeat domain family member B [Phyllostomus discolor]
MARELSQEALLDFLCQAGGRVANAALVSHFKSFLRDPDASPSQHQRRRELFKGFVNSVAAVRQDPDGTKYVVLKKKYRDLLGEEGLQRPGDRHAAAAAAAGGAAPCSPPGERREETPPQQQLPRRRRREKEQEEEPAGAAALAADPGCNGLPAGGAGLAARGGGGLRRGSRHRAQVSAAAAADAQVGAKGAAAETQGRCSWESLQNGSGELPRPPPLPRALQDPATAGKETARAPAVQDDCGAPRREREGAPTEPAPVLTEPLSPPPTVEATGSGASQPAPSSSPPSPRNPQALWTPGDLHYSMQQQQQQQQQQRTREWVARHPHIPEARDQGPIRAWSVLPDNFPSELGFRVPEPTSAPLDPSLCPHSHPPAVPESWPGNPPVTVFRSIRCQLSLQELDDFVDQENHSSEESSSGPRESPGGSEEGLHGAPGTPDWRKLRNSSACLSPKEVSSSRSPQGLRNRDDGHASQQVPTGANSLVGHSQETSPWPAPKLRRSLRRSSRARRAKSFSSDEECLEENLLQRSRRPPRSRKPSKAGAAASSPRVDAALIPKPADVKAAVSEKGRLHSLWPPGRQELAALVPHRPAEHRSCAVPLDAREHEWIVKLATGSWIQVLALFWEDPQLALHKDFLTGYTALHWIAKHGNLRALQDLVSGTQKAGIALDVNVKSSCGYTPLHLAAIHGHQGVMKLLVQGLASRVNVRDSSGKKPWQYLSSNTSGEIWQLLGAPRGKPIFPVYPLVRSSSPTRKAKGRDITKTVSRKASLAALLKSQHHKWKLANQYEKLPAPREREEYSD